MMSKPLIQNRIAHFSQKRDPRDFSLDNNKSGDSTGGSESSKDSLFGRLSSFFSTSKDGTVDSSSAQSSSTANDQYKAKMEKSNL